MYYGIMTYNQLVTNLIVNTLLLMGLNYEQIEITGSMVTISKDLITDSEFELLKGTVKMIESAKEKTTT
jgi:hypothetical protein